MRTRTEEEAAVFHFLEGLPGVRTSNFELTTTQMNKSIVDANEGLRLSFAETGFHDFDLQEPGEEGRVKIRIFAISEQGLNETTLSLYRARTNRDPRLWIARLKLVLSTARAGDLIVIAQDGTNAVVLNASDTEMNEDIRLLVASIFGF